jgi:hypothetical protein
MLYRVRGAILLGIFLVSIISWPRPTMITYFPYTPAGDEAFDFFKKVMTFHPISTIGGAIDVSRETRSTLCFESLADQMCWTVPLWVSWMAFKVHAPFTKCLLATVKCGTP